jgi:hypothetical protein
MSHPEDCTCMNCHAGRLIKSIEQLQVEIKQRLDRIKLTDQEPNKCRAIVTEFYFRNIYGKNEWVKEPIGRRCKRKPVKDGYCTQHYKIEKAD